MTEKILKNNQAVVAGEIISDFEFSHEVFGEGFYFVKLKVSRVIQVILFHCWSQNVLLM